ncbi:MAG: xanthine dehydrogenase family protein molybdopterin-binding subunit [Candidatus Binatia bacterium]
MKHIGQRFTSMTNAHLVAGKGTFTADFRLDGMLHLAMVRSPYASALVRGIDARAAEALPGVACVITAEELKANTRPMLEPFNTAAMGAKGIRCYALALERVRYVGEGVAAVVAEDRWTARRAADLVQVDYEELPVVSDAEAALAPGAQRVEPSWSDNVIISRDFRSGDPDAAFAAADGILSGVVRQHRYTGAAIEPRAYLASYDPYQDFLTFWASTQNPHPLRVYLAESLGIDESRIRVIEPHVGGAFGLKIPTFQEEPLVAYLARRLHRPVRWVAERSEDLLAGGHAREERIPYEVAFKNDGTITGLRAKVIADVGAPSGLPGWPMSFVSAYCIPTSYRIANTRVQLFSVVTNKCPWNAYRGYGKEAASFLMDRVMDRVARATGLDRAAVRLKNFIPPDQFPYSQVSGAMLDSGDYPKALRRVLAMIDYEHFPRLREQARREGRHIGIGIGFELTPEGCSMPQSTLIAGWDGATVRVNPSGQVTVLTGVTSPGTGNETGIAQIAADTLGVALDRVRVIQGDTDTCPFGLGNYSSRSIIMGGSAAQIAAQEVREKMARIAAHMLEVRPEEVDADDGRFFVKGAPARAVLFKDVASTAYRDCHGAAACEVEPGLEATRYFQHPNVYHQPETQGRFSSYPSWPYAAVACIVEVDPETGLFHILRYCTVHDSGTIINPLLAEANLHGGIAQGIGGAVFENLVYDQAGQLLTTTFMDYTCPTAADLPAFEVEHQETPSPFTPLGTKGVGESGVTAPLGALCSAIEDAFPELEISLAELPLTPNRVWAAIRDARQRSAMANGTSA